MFYKQKDSVGRLVSIGTTIDTTTLPSGFIEISKQEYDSLQRVFNLELDTPVLTPLNEKGELIYI